MEIVAVLCFRSALFPLSTVVLTSLSVPFYFVRTALRDLEPEGPLCLFVGDGCMNVLTSNENGPLQTNVKLTIHKMLTELRVK